MAEMRRLRALWKQQNKQEAQDAGVNNSFTTQPLPAHQRRRHVPTKHLFLNHDKTVLQHLTGRQPRHN